MPIYEYECLANGHRFEELQSITSLPLQTCRVCGGKVRKMISPIAFHLKGNGWYKDGYSSSAGSSQKLPEEKKDSCCGCENKPKCNVSKEA